MPAGSVHRAAPLGLVANPVPDADMFFAYYAIRDVCRRVPYVFSRFPADRFQQIDHDDSSILMGWLTTSHFAATRCG
jgi:hypothetical protein